jgi:hypothetical protein
MIRALLLAAALVLVLPAAANAACGVPPGDAVYETPAVQIYAKGKRLVACHRATGRSQGVGERADHTVVEVLGNRYVHTRFYASAAESADMQMDSIFDLRTDGSTTAPVLSEEIDNQVVALPGAVVTAGEDGVIARYTDGRGYEVISATAADTVAAAGPRLYWRDAAGAHTQVLQLPASDTAPGLPRARTIGRCTPRPGARLILRDASIVLTRQGGATWACRRGKTRRVSAGREASILGDRFVAYARPGYTGILDVANGRRRELPGPGATSAWALVAATPGGVSTWVYGAKAPKRLAAEPAREVAIGETAIAPVAFWLDPSGNPRSAAI